MKVVCSIMNVVGVLHYGGKREVDFLLTKTF